MFYFLLCKPLDVLLPGPENWVEVDQSLSRHYTNGRLRIVAAFKPKMGVQVHVYANAHVHEYMGVHKRFRSN